MNHEDLVLDAADGNRFARVRGDAGGAGARRRRDPARRARPLPLLRGAGAALRRARLSGGRDRLLRAHRGRRQARRRLPYMDHVAQTTPAGVQADVARGGRHLRSPRAASAERLHGRLLLRRPQLVARCRPAATGWPARSASTACRASATGRPGRSAPSGEMTAPILALQAGADAHITAEDNADLRRRADRRRRRARDRHASTARRTASSTASTRSSRSSLRRRLAAHPLLHRLAHRRARRGLAEGRRDLVDVAPQPVLAGLERADHGMSGRAVVARRVLVGARVAAGDVAAGHALAQMNPRRADRQAVGAALMAVGLDVRIEARGARRRLRSSSPASQRRTALRNPQLPRRAAQGARSRSPPSRPPEQRRPDEHDRSPPNWRPGRCGARAPAPSRSGARASRCSRCSR